MVNDQEFVALDDLAAVFQLTVRDEALGALSVSYKGKTIVLTPDQALASSFLQMPDEFPGRTKWSGHSAARDRFVGFAFLHPRVRLSLPRTDGHDHDCVSFDSERGSMR